MIILSNGYQLEFLVASGALAFDGKGYWWERPWLWAKLLKPGDFTIVLKTLKLYRNKGNLRWYNPHRVVKWVPGGTVNSIGLTGPGLQDWVERTLPRLDKRWNFIVSITASTVEEAEIMGRRVRYATKDASNIIGIQFNASCPNSPSEAELLTNTRRVVEIVRALFQSVKPLPILLKLSVQQDYGSIVRQLSPLIEAVEPNSVPWAAAFPGQVSPLPHKFGAGGVSGRAAQDENWQMIKALAAHDFQASCPRPVPVIGCSVWEMNDLGSLHALRAKAIAFGAVFLKYGPFFPIVPNIYADRWRKVHHQF